MGSRLPPPAATAPKNPQLQPGCGAQELRAVHSDLRRFDAQGAVQHWQQLASAAIEAPINLWAGPQPPATGNGAGT